MAMEQIKLEIVANKGMVTDKIYVSMTSARALDTNCNYRYFALPLLVVL